ncbi:MAG TPA: DinB family protein [Chitinophagales bacterium]|nr:DinB family protein [Chitinophagales bacterium]
MSSKLSDKYREIEIVKNRFLKKAEGLSNAQLNKIPTDGGWSAAQVLYHCGMAERETINNIVKNLQAHPTKIKENLRSKINGSLLMVFLRLPLKFKAPKIVSTVPENISFDSLKNDYDKSTDDFKKLLQDFPNELRDKLIFKHPIVGLLTIEQTVGFLAEHYLHHEKQLDKLL